MPQHILEFPIELDFQLLHHPEHRPFGDTNNTELQPLQERILRCHQNARTSILLQDQLYQRTGV